MTVQQLKYILKVAEVGSITEAAKLLFSMPMGDLFAKNMRLC